VQVLPRAWIDYARTLVHVTETGGYGAHWWMYPERPDVFFASGYEGQRIIVAPAHDVVVVRSAKSEIAQRPAVQAAMLRIVDAFPRV
jgi:CubicO group peptidase (beta-lactamase class C family)